MEITKVVTERKSSANKERLEDPLLIYALTYTKHEYYVRISPDDLNHSGNQWIRANILLPACALRHQH